MDADQTYHAVGVRSEPASHDFNAELYCGGAVSLWAGLLGFDPDLSPVAEWAEKWEPNADGSQWTFHLRSDNKGFSNGDPVTADTFVFSWKRMLDPKQSTNSYASILYDIKNAEDINTNGADPETLGVKAVDQWTFQVDLIGPRGLFPVIAGYTATVPTHPEFSRDRRGNRRMR